MKKPYVLYVAEIIYKKVSEIKKKNPSFSNITAIENFMRTQEYKNISSGEFHNNWLNELKKNNFVDKDSGKKIPYETIKLLEIQKNLMIKQLINFPELYDAKNHFPLEISQRAFDHLWRVCESYELWCKEVKKTEQIYLKLID